MIIDDMQSNKDIAHSRKKNKQTNTLQLQLLLIEKGNHQIQSTNNIKVNTRGSIGSDCNSKMQKKISGFTLEIKSAL